ncbi:hypothetical protein RKE29_19820 [Streptomyces sp. B1866]|uniref:hypothetical protein n=1 Tax=Streptomyces sp. B1866 TaxID=3075431 RepID=UPI002890325D|nr:hypothetical protein [Streptomyces sp. B1866]MDT3398869.1 hypothetical protein [Streptomyces sp. B1866]
MNARLPCTLFNEISSRAWVEVRNGHPVSCLLITHPRLRPQAQPPGHVEDQMLRLAAALGLADDPDDPVYCGRRLILTTPTRVRLRPDTCRHHALEITVPRPWTSAAAAGGTVLIMVGLDPLSSQADRIEAAVYISAGLIERRLLVGHTNAAVPAAPDTPHVGDLPACQAATIARNVQRLTAPPPRRTPVGLLATAVHAVEEAWHRHVTHRTLHRRLDTLRNTVTLRETDEKTAEPTQAVDQSTEWAARLLRRRRIRPGDE